jgi:hypothetical protein
VFSSKLHYRARVASKIRVYATGSAVGLNLSVNIADETFLDDQEVSAQNRMPQVPDDFIVEAAAFPGDEIVVKWRNTTGAAITGFVRADVDPI